MEDSCIQLQVMLVCLIVYTLRGVAYAQPPSDTNSQPNEYQNSSVSEPEQIPNGEFQAENNKQACNDASENGIIDCGKSNFTFVQGDIPPYVFELKNKTVGPFHTTVRCAIRKCCGASINLSAVDIIYKSREVEKNIGDADLAYPVVKQMLLTDIGISSGYIFLPIMETSGSIVLRKSSGNKTNMVGESLLRCWPLALIVTFSAGLAGTVMWILDRSKNGDEFPKSYFHGGWEGIWWAFVTMTTVGYGDRAPKSLPARCFGLLWMFVGIVLMSVLTATLTTALSAEQNNKFDLKGATVGVISGSIEELLAHRKGSIAVNFEKIDMLLSGVSNDSIDVALVDTNFALYQQHIFNNFAVEVDSIIENKAVFGVIVQNQEAFIERCFAKHISQSQFQIYDELLHALGHTKNGHKKEVAAETTKNVMRNMDMICLGLAVGFVIAATLCILWEVLYYRPKLKQHLEKSHSQGGNGNENENNMHTTRKVFNSTLSHKAKSNSVSSTTELFNTR